MPLANIHVKVDSDIKTKSEVVLDKIGISMSDLINMTLRRVIYERRIPFDTQIADRELPENMQVEKEEDLIRLIKEEIENDDGICYSIEDVKKHIKQHCAELESIDRSSSAKEPVVA